MIEALLGVQYSMISKPSPRPTNKTPHQTAAFDELLIASGKAGAHISEIDQKIPKTPRILFSTTLRILIMKIARARSDGIGHRPGSKAHPSSVCVG